MIPDRIGLHSVLLPLLISLRSYHSICHLVLVNSRFSGQSEPAVFFSRFRSNSRRHVGVTTFGVLLSALVIVLLDKQIVNITSGFKNISLLLLPSPPTVRLPVSSWHRFYKITRLNRESFVCEENTFCLFFDRTYEIQLNGGTPFDTGADLDPSISLKGT